MLSDEQCWGRLYWKGILPTKPIILIPADLFSTGLGFPGPLSRRLRDNLEIIVAIIIGFLRRSLRFSRLSDPGGWGRV